MERTEPHWGQAPSFFMQILLISPLTYTFISCVEHSVGGRGNPSNLYRTLACVYCVCSVYCLPPSPLLAAAKAGSNHIQQVKDPILG